MKKTFALAGTLSVYLLSVVFLFAIGCSKDESPTDSTSPAITNVNGSWSGKTSQNWIDIRNMDSSKTIRITILHLLR